MLRSTTERLLHFLTFLDATGGLTKFSAGVGREQVESYLNLLRFEIAIELSSILTRDLQRISYWATPRSGSSTQLSSGFCTMICIRYLDKKDPRAGLKKQNITSYFCLNERYTDHNRRNKDTARSSSLLRYATKDKDHWADKAMCTLVHPPWQERLSSRVSSCNVIYATS